MSLKSAAEAHIQSYAETFTKKNTPPPALAHEMTSLYHYPFVSFVLGKSYTVPTHEQMATNSIPYLEKWAEHGLLRFKLTKSRVDELSSTNAFCWLTWELEDQDGRKGWSWENVYVYRQIPDGRGGFEATFADNEFLALMQHAPEVLQGLPGIA